MKKITDFDVQGKRVLMRCGFDVGLDKDNRVIDDFRIKETIPSIEYLIKNKAKVVLMSHLGSPSACASLPSSGVSLLLGNEAQVGGKPGAQPQAKFCLGPVQEKLLEYLDCSVTKADDCIGPEIEEWVQDMAPGEILLLENLRFHAGEKNNDVQFAQSLSRLADIFINEAFSASHREHASIVGVPQFLPSGIGFLFEKEINGLNKVAKNPERPLIGIIGGAKLKSKIKPIKNLLNKVDFLLIAGRIGNAMLIKKGLIKGEIDAETNSLLEQIDLNNPKLVLPLDAAIFENNERIIRGLDEIERNDLVFGIGPKTIKEFCQKIAKAKTIFWAGPISNVDKKEFISGSLAIAQAIGKVNAFSIVGGGDTFAFLRKNNLMSNFDYLCTGGGAMLEYLSAGTLAGIEAIRHNL